MHFLIILTATTPLMALLLTGHSGTGVQGNSRDPDCKTPNEPFYEDIESLDIDLLYIYNETSGQCYDTLIDKNHNNTFKTRFECVSRCKTGQGADLCVGDPVNVCKKCNLTNNRISTTERSDHSDSTLTLNTEDCVDEGSSNESFSYEGFDENGKYGAFFYNATSMKCQRYWACGYPNRSLVTNFFYSDIFCGYECGGFNTSNIYGCNKTT
ncbi:uncharacterized protein LOC125946624 isoform X1 [Dermacentor silvarum]|uniref:uncharacterized protein LOC125946624 isoform X1 n=1 Tax=Dermacentor silvarum TaxID=543639 RepID=UPI0021017072|nr:uncharacterized protein LOC125946624 isoform X1 [Dermacentor silvarum]